MPKVGGASKVHAYRGYGHIGSVRKKKMPMMVKVKSAGRSGSGNPRSGSVGAMMTAHGPSRGGGKVGKGGKG